MNEKKSKKLRQLVRHLMDKGAVGNVGWRVYDESRFDGSKRRTDFSSPVISTGAVKLDPECGLKIYRNMKRNTV